MLSSGESLLIQRRRASLTQAEMGANFKMSRHSYGEYERDLVEIKTDHLSFDDLQPYEKCVILRKRAGMTQLEVALLMGLSRYWINQKEIGRVDCQDLLTFLEEQQ